MTPDFPLTIKRLRAARRLRLRVLENGDVVVTCPLRLPARLIDEFVNEHRAWIIAQRQVVGERQSALTEQRAVMLLHGREYQFRLTINSTKKPAVTKTGDQLVVTAATEDHAAVRQLLEKWYRTEAKQYFQARVPLLADLVNRDVKTVTIRSQRSRWGSCSSRLTISLNWRLILTPDWVSDYVIYHELAHLTHMNHSSRFWQLVADYYPDYQKAEAWLKDHHGLLQF